MTSNDFKIRFNDVENHGFYENKSTYLSQELKGSQCLCTQTSDLSKCSKGDNQVMSRVKER